VENPMMLDESSLMTHQRRSDLFIVAITSERFSQLAQHIYSFDVLRNTRGN
jgi:hypothetical protein